MANLLDRLRVLAVKVETTPGTEEAGSWTSSDAPFRARSISASRDQGLYERDLYDNTLGMLADVPGLRQSDITFETELVGSGDHTSTSPPFATLLRGCGYEEITTLESAALTDAASSVFVAGETITDGAGTATVAVTQVGNGTLYFYGRSGTLTSITGGTGADTGTLGAASSAGRVYKPTSTESDMKALTFRHYNDGHLHKISGARGNVTLQATVGEPVRLAFSFEGKDPASDSDTAMISSSYTANLPPVFKAVGLSLNPGSGTPYNPSFSSLELTTGNELQKVENANDSTGAGYSETKITQRNGSGSMDVLFTTLAEHDWFSYVRSATTGPLTFTVGDTAGNQFLVQAPNAQYANSTLGERSGQTQASIDLKLKKSLGNDELIILAI